MDNFVELLFSPLFLNSLKLSIGFCIFFKIFHPLTKLLCSHLILSKIASQRRALKKAGDWAIVTGATDGIGKAYALLLAKDGLNIVLISRSQEKLDDVASEITRTYNVKVQCIAADFSRVDIYETIKQKLSGLSIACLVNNVGMSLPYPNYFCDPAFDVSLYENLLKTNCLSMVRMTHIVLPDILKRNSGGAIINISSASGDFPVPFLTVYSATKAFADFFSRGIAAEVQDMSKSTSRRIIVQTVLPYFVATKLSGIRRPSFFAPSPLSYASHALDLLGVEDRTFGCLSHALQHFVLNLVPGFIMQKFVMKQMRKTRAIAIRRIQQKSKST